MSPAPYLPFDVISHILSNISKDKIRNFLPYLLINKDWCHASLCHIWANPFRDLLHGNKTLISTYLSCLKKSHLTTLKSKGFDLPQIQPLFNYASFLKQLDYVGFLLSVFGWCNLEQNGNSEQENISLIVKSLLHLFCDNSLHLNTLIIQTEEKKIYDEEYFLLLFEEDFREMLTPIRQITIHTHFSMERFFNGLSKHCRNVPPFNNSISASSWILSQNKLTSLTIFISCWDICVIINSITSQRKTLKHLKFDYVNFKNCHSQKDILECEKLEVLEFRNCRHLEDDLIEDLVGKVEEKNEGITRKLKNLKTLIRGKDCYEVS
ncbi:12259_t:CDS:2 [Acaulospora morrowiae]|uniref:12259_t:CDS:1 n=1 Tax=Acaulospora morrowiae TaxID=94023 RepID=A0A9N9GLI8_9GLOM|nr:12259_t:CDS:2 [Acaulospora morrowiae]